MSEWISVKDRLPIDKNKVSVYNEIDVLTIVSNECCFNRFTAGTMPKPWGRFDEHDDEVTHWMPLPEPPKEIK